MRNFFSQSRPALWAAGLLFLLTAACTKAYQPHTEWEKEALQKARKDIYPDDVRKDLEKYRTTEVVWPGIIAETEFYENADNYQLVMLLEHHYFNWEREATDRDIRYFLSSQGEGWFQTSWYFKKDTEKSFIDEKFAPGNLAFVYGVPDTVADGDVILTAAYVRTVDRENYDAEFYDYRPESRPGQ